jgi:hypothetical protein
LGARGWVAFAEHEYPEALNWAERSLELVGEIKDPDHIADVYEFAIPSCCAMGRFREARRLAMVHGEVVEPLTPHHRLHGVSVLLEVEELAGDWDSILGVADRTTATVEENLGTPCIRNARCLLVTALAAAESGDADGADALEDRANEVVLEGYDFVLAAPRARLALARGDADEALRQLPGGEPLRVGFALASTTARFDALAAARERATLEREAPPFLRPGTYVEPFALRALGIVREDEDLMRQAAARFAEMRLMWHAGKTRALL